KWPRLRPMRLRTFEPIRSPHSSTSTPGSDLDRLGGGGHCSRPADRTPTGAAMDDVSKTTAATGTAEVNAGHLRAFVERIERLEEEKKALADDIKDVYGEAKANGFDARIMR